MPQGTNGVFGAASSAHKAEYYTYCIELKTRYTIEIPFIFDVSFRDMPC